MSRGWRLVAVACVTLTAACTGPAPSTADQLRAAIEDYRQAKPGVTEERIDALFARLDADVAALRAAAAAQSGDARADATRRADALDDQRQSLRGAYASARIARLGAAAGSALKAVGDSIGQGLEDAGQKLRESLGTTPPDTRPAE